LLRPEAIAFISTLILTPVVRELCIHWRLFDSVGPLKIHSKAIPRLGGIAIGLAFSAAMIFPGNLSRPHAWTFFAALILIWTAGLADDIWPLSPILRLTAQIGGAMLLWCAGCRLPWLKAAPANLTALCVLTVIFINSFNFLDGSDGLCAGVAAIIAAAYVMVPAFALSPLGSAVAWSLLGISAGFLAFNFPPARIFLGDSGSTLLGFCAAFLAFDFYRANALNNRLAALAVPLLMSAVPLLDGILTILRRLRAGRSPLNGDRRHVYDLMLGLDWSPRRVALTLYALTIATCVIAWLVLKSDFRHALLICGAGTSALVVAAIRLGALESTERKRPPLGMAESR